MLHTYVELTRPVEWIADIGFDDPAAAVARVAAEFNGWAPELTALITDADAAPVPRMIHALPDAHRWDRGPGVTLLGDAAHLMPPSGEGANLAMLDGAELATSIAAHPDDVEAAFATFEATMFTRSATEAADAHVLLDLCLGDRARSVSSTSSPVRSRQRTTDGSAGRRDGAVAPPLRGDRVLPVGEDRAQRGHEGERLVERDVVVRRGDLDDRRVPPEQLVHVVLHVGRDEVAVLALEHGDAAVDVGQVVVDRPGGAAGTPSGRTSRSSPPRSAAATGGR